MANTKKLIQAAAGAAGGEVVNFEDVFSITLYEGNATANRVIDTGIDFVENEGLVWIKQRNTNGSHYLVDTIRGVSSSGTTAVFTHSIANSNPLNGYFNSFETNGIQIDANSDINGNNDSFACYSFRQHEKFFDVVQYTGTGSTQNISHSLNDEVGFMFIKRIGANSEGTCYHRSLGATKYMTITSDAIEATSSTRFNNTAPTTTQFTVGSDSNVNASGGTYIAYLWAHNNGTGIFGPDGDHDVVKCGTYTGSGSANDKDISVGFEPQWVIIKKADTATAPWFLIDIQRGTANRIGSVAEDTEWFEVNTNSNASGSGPIIGMHRTDGFRINTTSPYFNTSGADYIYIAIRKTLHKEPENVGDVFSMITRTATTPCYVTGFPVDFYVQRDSNTVNYRFGDRSTNGCDFQLSTGLITQDTSGIENRQWDYQNGVGDSNSASTSKRMAAFKRARGFFDTVDYQATGTAQDIEHSLGVAPELLFVKARDESGVFAAWSTGLTGSQYMLLNSNDGYRTGANYWDSTAPTATSFRVGTEDYTNKNGGDFVAYMFASNEFQKIGTYTGNGATNQNIDLGFSNGVDWLMIKRIDNSGNWFTFDSTRGINSGNDLYFQLNGNSNSSSFDLVDPYSAGFSAVKAVVSLNDSGATYLYWAIAAE